MRYSDRPIATPREDRLGRYDFAYALAKSIFNLKSVNDGFVIGIVGPWGSGKSSVIELLARSLLHMEILDKLRLMSGFTEADQEHVEHLAALYENVASDISIARHSHLNTELWERNHRKETFDKLFKAEKDARSAERYYELLQTVNREPSNLIIRFSPWLIPNHAELTSALLSDIARGIGHRYGSEVTENFAALVGRLAEVSSVLGTATDLVTGTPLGKLISGSINSTKSIIDKVNKGPTLDQARSALQLSLKGIKNKKIIVIIDDLDRLTPSEAVSIVSVVKGLGYLPNVLYILSYDIETLSALIKTELKIDGFEYLKKIVQYETHLPPCDTSDLLRLLNSDLSDLLPDLDDGSRARLAEAWEFILKDFLQTPRDVKRFINAYSISAAALADDTDPVDLLVLEALKTFTPEVYRWIAANLEDLVF